MPVYDVISEIVIDACFGMETYQCIGISLIEGERDRESRLAAHQNQLYSQVYSKSV